MNSKAINYVFKAVELGVHSIWLTVDTVVIGKRVRDRAATQMRKPVSLPIGEET